MSSEESETHGCCFLLSIFFPLPTSNVFSCENNYTLSLLKNQLNFSGFVVSDWGAVHSTVPSALAGLDVEVSRKECCSLLY